MACKYLIVTFSPVMKLRQNVHGLRQSRTWGLQTEHVVVQLNPREGLRQSYTLSRVMLQPGSLLVRMRGNRKSLSRLSYAHDVFF